MDSIPYEATTEQFVFVSRASNEGRMTISNALVSNDAGIHRFWDHPVRLRMQRCIKATYKGARACKVL